ncbi:dihydrofolate reductase [Solirubrobacter sp. CPCC 204708]|uniref:Dihydrofolate reductase family protein n=1 Tax=Solirubrobacter deserti TaxID=2282478 RepID=A0ABT4RSQ4_9ACTN|nr:dihydrofolate reductase family protein [Solirubrobacter deserti]MBE2315890.1 dihydrofolate reductase [Solirubrobacter deserti]MDA0141571.1 dihydrofolate reductase family protein [Solirubrobacter deserti]
MSKVIAQLSISLDGFYAGPRDDEPNWFKSTEAAGFFRVTRWVTEAMAWRDRQHLAGGEQDVHSEIVAESFERPGAYVMGRRMFDGGERPWGEEPPFRNPVFVVTHRERERLERLGGTSFEFVTDGLESAIEQARAAAGGKEVAIAGGGTIIKQALELGLLDEIELHIVPVILGAGQRLLDVDLDVREGLELVPERTVATPEVTHIRYRVEGRKPLVLDDRGGKYPGLGEETA